MLVTVDRYQTITSDLSTASGAVASALTDAQLLLEERLGRPLEQDERTERARMFQERRGMAVYPQALPLISVSDPSGASIEGAAFVGGSPTSWADFAWSDGYRDITYVGGYDPAETDPNEEDFLPRTLERAIAWAAYADLQSAAVTASLPAGVTSARVGDVALTWGGGGFFPGASGEIAFSASVVRRYRRRRDLVA
jgi:hypothetical protein